MTINSSLILSEKIYLKLITVLSVKTKTIKPLAEKKKEKNLCDHGKSKDILDGTQT